MILLLPLLSGASRLLCAGGTGANSITPHERVYLLEPKAPLALTPPMATRVSWAKTLYQTGTEEINSRHGFVERHGFHAFTTDTVRLGVAHRRRSCNRS